MREQRGIARYVRNLLREFATLDASLRVTLYVETDEIAAAVTLLQSLHPGYLTRGDVRPIEELPDTRADIVWYAWNFITTPTTHAKRVVTIHDIAPMLQLDHRWWKVLKRAKFRRRYLATVRGADTIIAASAFSRRELHHHLGVDPSAVTVTLMGADDLALNATSDHGPLHSAGIDGPFFLHVGAQDGRKNMQTLYRAMTELWARGHRVPLVQCGPSMSKETRALLDAVPWLVHVGYVSDAQLATLYREATALVFPSRYEGFGLPVAEAMRAGTPVLCADGSAVAEVVGPAALLVPWNDADAFAQEMERLAQHPLLRATLASRGRVQASRFTWAQTARATLNVFARTMGANTAGVADAVDAHTSDTRAIEAHARYIANMEATLFNASAPLTPSAPVRPASRERSVLKA